MVQGIVSNMLDENVVQPLLVTTSALNLATECVRMILKVSHSLHKCKAAFCSGSCQDLKIMLSLLMHRLCCTAD